MRFVLQNPTGIYFSNDSIRGLFIFDTKVPIKLSWINLELLGRISVSFNVNGKTKEESGIYSASRILVNQSGCVWRKRGSNNNEEEFPVGNHNFDFSFWLPENSLPSFSSLHGNITYILKAKLYNSKGIFKFCETSIKVCKPYNFMENPSLLQSKTISNLSLCFKPKITVPRSVCIIGKPISLLIEIENNSFDSIKSVIIGLEMRIIYKGKSKELLHLKETEKTVAKVLWKKEVQFHVSPNNYGIMERQIPTKIETETMNDSLIKINYCLFVKFITKEKKICSELSLPITFAKTLLPLSNVPPPPYVNNFNNSNENVEFNLSVYPPSYDDVLSS